MSTAQNKRSTLDSTELRRLKGIGHELKPVVTIGGKGLSESVVEELDRALNDHELIKIKMPPGSKEEREAFSDELAAKTGAQLIHSIGRMALLLRRNPNANPRLSNLVRFSD
ncbi:YhbY family RNA-binding protein [Psychrobacter sp. FDAARGOS_221]|uniref:YhbY family RNA-binding protein n=1 Tax=Psychrobacter sp. FDAARGOS_221 TaxID=1975705 RepID=UPI000BB57B40|nr:YhbY family RNA-binding protein [Psychrobacter sp. FDAARGOS_221]PNK60231.1 ribosome assembly RNA-binding protein YhbY [Psychrobacter sp. FDAARGOS_221]